MTSALGTPAPVRTARAADARRAAVRDGAIIAGIALVLRVATVVWSRGGYQGDFGYDGAVYYAAADALTFGRFPYTDFVLLHPPIVMLALTPFAAIGRALGSDHVGFVVATIAFQAIGAMNAALVYVVARRWRLTRFSALVGGLFYAVWFGAVGAESGVRLEPLGNGAFLVALLVLSAARGTPARRRQLVIAGAALAIAISTKIWWVVPAAIVIGWQCRLRRRAVVPLLAGAAGVFVAVDLTFVVHDADAAWHDIVLDQLGRARIGGTFLERLARLAAVRTAFRYVDPGAARFALVGVVAAVALVVAILAWRSGVVRIALVLLAAQLGVLLLAPSYFSFYADFISVPAALVVAAAAHAASARARRVAHSATLAVVSCCAIATLAQVVSSRSAVTPFPGQRLARAVRHDRCVMADAPMALIELDALSRGLSHGCPNWIDVTGRTYGVDKAHPPVRRARNARWQADLRRYLLGGDAVILIRPPTGLSPATSALIRAHPVIATTDGYTVYCTSCRRSR